MNRRMMLAACWVVATLAAVGCAKKETAPASHSPAAPVTSSPPAPAPPPPPAATCGDVNATIERVMKTSVAAQRDMAPEMKQAILKLAGEFGAQAEKHCIADAWSPEARTCIRSVEEQEDFGKCEHMLSATQQGLLEEDMKRVMLEVTAEMTAQEAPSGPIFEETGIPACNDYLRTLERFFACSKVPDEARAAMRQAVQQMKSGWASLGGKSAPPETLKAVADGCKTASEALEASADATGCRL
jgi:hypothetical protein